MSPTHSSLRNARIKLSRAAVQLRELNDAVSSFLRSKPYRLESSNVRGSEDRVWKFVTEPIPDGIYGQVGDLLFNLRAPLDQAASAAVSASGGSESDIYFPIASDEADLDIRLQSKKLKRLPEPAKDIIRSFQCYRGGNQPLWVLHQLHKNDKHRSSLAPIILPDRLRMRRLCFWRGQPLVVGSLAGQHLLANRDPDVNAKTPIGQPTALYEIGQGEQYLEFEGSSSNLSEVEFLTTTNDAEFDYDASPELALVVTGYEVDRVNVCALLAMAYEIVRRIVDEFEAKAISH